MHPFEALAEPVRRRIVDVLASGEHTSGQIAELIGSEFRISRTAVSKHLRVLRDARLVNVRAELQFRWYFLLTDGVEELEYAVADLRMKLDRRVGWNSERGCEHDPLAAPPFWTVTKPVPLRGPGRPYRRGARGAQKTAPVAADPDAGLFRVWPVPPPPSAST